MSFVEKSVLSNCEVLSNIHQPINLTTKMIKTSIEIKANLIVLKFGKVKLLKNFIHCHKCKTNINQTNIFEDITLCLFIIYRFIKFKM